MLSRLSIRNIALIRNVELEFSSGLNILSGETGAGKSIIVDGLMLLLGARYDKTLLRYGEQAGLVEGVFDVTDGVRPALGELGLDEDGVRPALGELGLDEDDVLIVTRKFSVDGKSEIRLNGRPAAASMLRALMTKLVDIYGQNEYQTLSDKAEHLRILDYFARGEIAAVLPPLKDAYDRLRGVEKELGELGNVSEREKNVDTLKYQIAEIEDAKVEEGEEDALKERRMLIASAERIREALASVADDLTESAQFDPAAALVGRSLGALDRIGGMSESYRELYDRLKSVSIELEDISATAIAELENMNFDEREIDRLEQRYDLITALRRKYGTVEMMRAYLERAKEQLYKLENCAELYASLQAEREKILDGLYAHCDSLSRIRRAAAERLAALVKEELSSLGMEHSDFAVQFADTPTRDAFRKSVTANGFDEAEFYLSPNVGQPLKPLVKIISGGEMSRFMLALKVITSRADDIPTLIFDEIDTGISGGVGQAVAKKLARISRAHQVLCVTHLPQIASMADSHFYIEKRVEGGETLTEVRPLDRDGIVDELSRLTGSKNITATSRSTAEEMKAWSDAYKKTLNSPPNSVC